MPSSPTIVMIDDDPTACQLFQRIVGEAGYQVFTATTSARGLTLIRGKKPQLVFLDIKMPKTDGLALLRRIRRLRRNLRVVMLTGYATLDSARQAMQFGADDYVTKPLDLTTLMASIRDAIGIPPTARSSPRCRHLRARR